MQCIYKTYLQLGSRRCCCKTTIGGFVQSLVDSKGDYSCANTRLDNADLQSASQLADLPINDEAMEI